MPLACAIFSTARGLSPAPSSDLPFQVGPSFLFFFSCLCVCVCLFVQVFDASAHSLPRYLPDKSFQGCENHAADNCLHAIMARFNPRGRRNFTPVSPDWHTKSKRKKKHGLATRYVVPEEDCQPSACYGSRKLQMPASKQSTYVTEVGFAQCIPLQPKKKNKLRV